jgi:uracil-DNA glycosylase
VNLAEMLPAEWRDALRPFLDPVATAALGEFVAAEYAAHTVYPPIEDLFSAYRLCLPGQTRVLILGQDPYHGPGQAHGLSFSVRDGVRIPPSLRNVFKELAEDCCCSTRCSRSAPRRPPRTPARGGRRSPTRRSAP